MHYLNQTSDRCVAGSCRPITILPTVSKILERIAHQVYSYLVEGKISSPTQFGFRPNLSTEVTFTQFTDSVLNKGHVTGAVFVDLSHAFNIVNQPIPYSKFA